VEGALHRWVVRFCLEFWFVGELPLGNAVLGKTNPYTSVQGLAHHDPPSRLHLGSHRDDPRPVIYLVILSSGLHRA
jgi:hypothetical protein